MKIKVNKNGELLDYLYNNLEGEKVLNDDSIDLTMVYIEKFYPFKSVESQIKPEDFIAREEIEMKYFLSSFLDTLDLEFSGTPLFSGDLTLAS